MFIQQLKHQGVVLPCGTARLEMQVASLVPGWLLAVRSRLHHLLLRYTESTGTLLSFCSLLDDGKGRHWKPMWNKPTRETYKVCNAAENPTAYFGIPSRAVAASPTWRDGRLAGHTTPLYTPQALSRHSRIPSTIILAHLPAVCYRKERPPRQFPAHGSHMQTGVWIITRASKIAWAPADSFCRSRDGRRATEMLLMCTELPKCCTHHYAAEENTGTGGQGVCTAGGQVGDAEWHNPPHLALCKSNNDGCPPQRAFSSCVGQRTHVFT